MGGIQDLLSDDQEPLIIGGLLLFVGYAWGSLSRVERPISEDLLKFYRNEQMARLKKILSISRL